MHVPMLTAEALIDPQIQANFHIEASITQTTPLHYHDYYEIFLITSGKCIHRVNGQEQVMGTGTLVFVRPQDRHSYDIYNNMDCQFININFYTGFIEAAFDFFGDRNFSSMLETMQLPASAVLPSGEMYSLVGKAEQIHLFASIDKYKARIFAKSFLVDALTFLFANYKNENKKSIPDWLDSVLFQLQKKDNFTAGLNKLYMISGRSTGHLNRVFKQYLGTTPTTYINNLKLNHAKNLLVTTNIDILDIALESGFENLSHFYHLFKEKYGISPGKIRTK